jgi:hypothetical protein
MILKEFLQIKEIDMVALDPTKPSEKILNKVFSKVSRIYAISLTNRSEIVLDINSDLFFLKIGDKIEVLLEESPFESQKKEEIKTKLIFKQEDLEGLEFLKDFEYVMHGVIFHSGIEDNKVFIYASFGGLLMKYFGLVNLIKMKNVNIDKKILLLVNKVKN